MFGREDYILSMEEMEENGFPLPTSQLSQATKVSNDNGKKNVNCLNLYGTFGRIGP